MVVFYVMSFILSVIFIVVSAARKVVVLRAYVHTCMYSFTYVYVYKPVNKPSTILPKSLPNKHL